MEINKDNLKKFRQDFQNAVKELEAKYGVSVEMGNISFTSMSFTTKLEVKNNDPETKLKANQLINRTAQLHGAKFNIGDVVRIAGVSYEIIDFNTRSPKYPVLVKSLIDGKRYKYTLDAINNLI